MSPDAAARQARARLAALARPAGDFDASRYFRGAADLQFHNVGMAAVRRLAREIVEARRDDWTIEEAMACAEILIDDSVLEVKAVAVEIVARFHREFAPRWLARWKAWLATNRSANWATTDAICGVLIGPLLRRRPDLVPSVASWARHRNLWVRRAAAVSLVGLARRGQALDAAYAVARALHRDQADLIQKAVGWLLREAGKTDMARLERYLRAHGPTIPRTSVRYAIERFPPPRRRALLVATKPASA